MLYQYPPQLPQNQVWQTQIKVKGILSRSVHKVRQAIRAMFTYWMIVSGIGASQGKWYVTMSPVNGNMPGEGDTCYVWVNTTSITHPTPPVLTTIGCPLVLALVNIGMINKTPTDPSQKLALIKSCQDICNLIWYKRNIAGRKTEGLIKTGVCCVHTLDFLLPVWPWIFSIPLPPILLICLLYPKHVNTYLVCI